MADFASDIFSMEFNNDGTIYEGHLISITERMEQMCKHQDQTYTGTAVDEVTGETFHYGMVTDGHGGNDCIRFLRSLTKKQLAEILGKKNPVETMAKLVNDNVRGYNCGGATMIVVKVYKDRIECINCGDSQAAVFKDGALLYLSKEHNWEDQAERERLLKTGNVFFTPSTNIKVISKTQLVGCYTEYANFKDDNSMLACTQALGSNGKTGYAPHHEIIPLLPGSDYRIVIGSDGLWDMINREEPEDTLQLSNMTADEGVNMVMSRWLQPWEMRQMDSDIVENGQYSREHCDDICMIAMDIRAV